MANIFKRLHHLSLLLFFSILLLFPVITPATALDSGDTTPKATEFIRASCGATLYPDMCYTSLVGYAKAVDQSPSHLARIAVAVSLRRARRAAAYVFSLLRNASPASKGNSALQDCASTLRDAVDQMRRSLAELRHPSSGEAFRFQMSDVQTWMSAALTNEDTCTDGLEESEERPESSSVSGIIGEVKEVTSNALALVNRCVS